MGMTPSASLAYSILLPRDLAEKLEEKWSEQHTEEGLSFMDFLEDFSLDVHVFWDAYGDDDIVIASKVIMSYGYYDITVVSPQDLEVSNEEYDKLFETAQTLGIAEECWEQPKWRLIAQYG